jgi:hypothetical protein
MDPREKRLSSAFAAIAEHVPDAARSPRSPRRQLQRWLPPRELVGGETVDAGRGVSRLVLGRFKDTTVPSEKEAMTAETTPLIRELDRRISNGIEVRLLWRPHDEVVLVAVSDARTEESFVIEVREGEKALDVFNHPFAYAASRPKLAAIAS